MLHVNYQYEGKKTVKMLLPNCSHVSQMNCIGEKPQEKQRKSKTNSFQIWGQYLNIVICKCNQTPAVQNDGFLNLVRVTTRFPFCVHSILSSSCTFTI